MRAHMDRELDCFSSEEDNDDENGSDSSEEVPEIPTPRKRLGMSSTPLKRPPPVETEVVQQTSVNVLVLKLLIGSPVEVHYLTC